ncbi:Beta-lactamase class C [Alloalcanivorax dieselolei B5]|uniref:Beta-lactamase class C n=2 Tax=Alloalcanivorax dieselolei TaxID=285091 RepID=K0CB21_ALCDB|nr:Beta-lactamase class C [Alloalcanivorax dieselolei B5]GGJ86391.1 EstA family serine hydrolase [Alloalcanivorax dieselolei]
MTMTRLSLPAGFSASAVPVPRHLTPVTDRGDECAAAEAGLRPQQVATIWRHTRALYRTGMNPAIALCLRRRGQVFLDRTLGYADAGQQRLLTTDTPICLFSASKAVTAMLVHHLAEQGELDLDRPVCHYIPEYGAMGKHRTTLMHVLTHRAGVPRIHEPVAAEDLFDYDRIMTLLCRAKPENPGRQQAYHAITAGFVLGEVIRRVTGESIDALLDRVIRRPMGMRYFTYGLREPAVAPAKNAVTGLQLSPVNAFLTHAVGAPLDEVVDLSNDPRFLDATIPAGNLYATAEEASRFFQMLLNDGRYQDQQLFRPETVRFATGRAATKGGRLDRTLMVPLAFSPGFMLGARALSLYGPGTSNAFGHLGFISIYCWADRDRDLAGALLTTGKAALGRHFPALLKLQMAINRHTA